MERAKLESELKDIQRLVDRIPPEVLAELKRQQQHTRERWSMTENISRRSMTELHFEN